MENLAQGVSAQTALCGILGWPVGHSLSPVLQNTLARRMGVDLCYGAFPVASERLGEAVRGAYALGLLGLNVTVPHKQAVMEFVCGVDPLAQKIGAVNTLVRREDGFYGYNTDILGLEKSLELRGVSLAGATVAVLGAGGAAYAAAALAEKNGAARLFLVNRTREKAEALAGRLSLPVTVRGYEELDSIPAVDVLLQTTSVGMGAGHEEEAPLPEFSLLERTKFVLDVIYTPWETRLLREARRRGCETENGFPMLMYQGTAAFSLWTGQAVPDEVAAALARDVGEAFREGRL